MTSAKDIILEYVIPALGSVIAVLMFLSSMPAVLKAVKSGNIGDLNPVPYPAIVANCVGWVSYSFVITNGFVLGPNAPGVVIGLFYTMITLGLTKRRSQNVMTGLMTAYACLLIIVGSVGAFMKLEQHALRLLWGFTCNFILLTYYAAPLSTIWIVARTRSAVTINPLMALANCINGTLWTAYGIAISDLFISVPNGVGLLMSLVLIACVAVFWKKDQVLRKSAHQASSDSTPPDSLPRCSPGRDIEKLGTDKDPGQTSLRSRHPIQETLTRTSAHDDAHGMP